MEIFYPVERLFSNPRVFYAIANYLGGPEGEILKTSFYELMEYGFQEYEDPDDIEFAADEVCFSVDDETGEVQITLNSGLASVLTPIEGEIRAQISNDHEMAATSAIYKRLVEAIEESNPELAGDIVLCSPPTPGNYYLRSENGERFEGSFHLLSDPEKLYKFNVEIIDVTTDQLKATIQPIR